MRIKDSYVHIGFFPSPAGWPKDKERKMTKMYIIDDGNMFEGTVEQFKDSFFDNANDETIQHWCDENGWSLDIKEVQEN